MHEQLGYDVMPAAFEVYKELGHGFLEKVYSKALQRELSARGFSFQTEVEIPIHYKHQELECFYKADILVENSIILELKAVKELAPEHEAQILNYLKATEYQVGYLINFGSHPQAQWQRFILTH